MADTLRPILFDSVRSWTFRNAETHSRVTVYDRDYYVARERAAILLGASAMSLAPYEEKEAAE